MLGSGHNQKKMKCVWPFLQTLQFTGWNILSENIYVIYAQ